MKTHITSVGFVQRTRLFFTLAAAMLLILITASRLVLADSDSRGALDDIRLDVEMSQQVYQDNETVKGKVEISIAGEKQSKDGRTRSKRRHKRLKGRLDVKTFNDQTGELVHRRRFRVKLRQNKSKTVRFAIGPRLPTDTSYTTVATFFEKRGGQQDIEALAEETARFGIRPKDFPENIPDHILRGEAMTLDVPDILDLLSKSADQGKAVEISMGSEKMMIEVQRLVVLAPGVEIPGFGRPSNFVGQVIDRKGHAVEDSQVALTVIKNTSSGDMQLSGMIQVPNPDEDAPVGDIDSMWIEPVASLQNNAPQAEEEALDRADAQHDDRYLMYHMVDTVPPPGVGPEGHVDPIVVSESDGESAGATPEVQQAVPAQVQQALPAVANQTVPNLNYRVDLQVYQDHNSSDPWYIIWAWINDTKAAFKNILRRTGSNTVTVNNHSITRWETIPKLSNTKCNPALNEFKTEVERGDYGLPLFRSLQVVFTETVTDCGGIAFLGSKSSYGSSGRAYSLAEDTSSLAYDKMVLAQGDRTQPGFPQ